jgi:hypothetical protein
VNAPLLSALSVGPARVARRCVAAVGWPGAGRRPGGVQAVGHVGYVGYVGSTSARRSVAWPCWPFPFCWLCWLSKTNSQHCQQTAVWVSYQFDIVGIVGTFGTRFKSLAAWDYMQLLYIYNTILEISLSTIY